MKLGIKISQKIFTARSFKLGWMIMSRLPGVNLKKCYIFFELLPFANLGIGKQSTILFDKQMVGA